MGAQILDMLVFKRSKAVWLLNGLVFKCHSKSEQPDHSKSDQNSHHLVFYAIVQKHVWDQLFTVDTIWNIGETGDIDIAAV